jgi:hypothetical protein
MGLKSSLKDWANLEYPQDFEDQCFIRGYQDALRDASQLVLTMSTSTNAEAARQICCLDDLDMPMGN